jgi:hypothetical protein
VVIPAGEVALEAAHGLDSALALRFLALQVLAGLRIDATSGDRDDVQRSVELAVAATMEAVSVASPRGGRDRCHASHPSKMSVAGEALSAGSLADEDRGAERAASSLGEQLRTMNTDEVAQLALERLGFACQRRDALDLLARHADTSSLRHRSQPAGDAL